MTPTVTLGGFYLGAGMKTRIIQTRFWDDEINEQIDIYTQHLYLYLLSSKHINMCGYFQLRNGVIQLEAKLTENQLKSAKEQLQRLKKVYFKDGWIWVVNARKNNSYENSPKNKVACENELSKIPRVILEFFDSSIDSSMDTTPKPQSQSKSISKIIIKELLNKKEKEQLITYLVEKGMNKELVENELSKFISYWTEKNIAGTKERWQMEKTFEVKKRLTTWFNNINKFGGKNEPRGYEV